MESILSNFYDDFLDGSTTVYNYAPSTHYRYLFYAQIVGIQNIGPKYYNELAMAKEYLIQYTLDGEGYLKINNEEMILKKSDLLIIPNYYHHIFKPVEGKKWRIAFIHIFENEMVMEIVNRLYKKHRYVIHNVEEEKIVGHLTHIIDLLSEDLRANECKVSAEVYSLLMEICEQSDAFEGDFIDNELASVINFLRQNYNTPIRLKDVLERANYSKNHLERLFKSKMHMTIQEYVAHLRLARAQELILTTNMYFKEIALAVGLTDYRSLVYLFRNTIGLTPTEYREKGLLRRNQDEKGTDNINEIENAEETKE